MGIEDRNIQLMDMLKKICLKWRAFVVWAILFAVAFDVLYVVKNKIEIANIQASQDYDEEVQLEGLENVKKVISDLTRSMNTYEVETVYTTVSQYNTYVRRMNELKEYQNNSYVMQFNSNSVPTCSLTYNVDTHYEVSYPTVEKRDQSADITNGIVCGLINNDLLDNIKTALNVEKDNAYINELISVVAEKESAIVNISVFGISQEMCETISACVQDRMEELAQEIAESICPFDLKLVDAHYEAKNNTTVQNTQFNNMNAQSTLRNYIVLLKNNMTDDQKLLLDNILIQNELQAQIDSQQIRHYGEILVPELDYLSIKYVLAGIIFGFVVVFFFVAFLYFISGKLHTDSDIKNSYNLRLFGYVNKIEGKRGAIKVIDRMILHIFEGKQKSTDEQKERMIYGKIRLTAEQKNMHSLFLAGSYVGPEYVAYAESLVKLLKADGIEVFYGKSIVYDFDAMEQMVKTDGVVLIETEEHSEHEDIEKEITVCKSHEIPIIGAVVIK